MIFFLYRSNENSSTLDWFRWKKFKDIWRSHKVSYTFIWNVFLSLKLRNKICDFVDQHWIIHLRFQSVITRVAQIWWITLLWRVTVLTEWWQEVRELAAFVTLFFCESFAAYYIEFFCCSSGSKQSWRFIRIIRWRILWELIPQRPRSKKKVQRTCHKTQFSCFFSLFPFPPFQ